jgi:CBS-domain-containing membrane protein
MNELRIRDLMTSDVVTVRIGDKPMLDHRFRHLVVIDEDGDLAGLVTHRELL